MDRVNNDFVPSSHAPNWTSRQSYFPRRSFIQTCFKKLTVKWLKKQNCFLCRGSTSASLKIDEIFAIRKKLASF